MPQPMSRDERAANFVPGVDDFAIDVLWWAYTPERLAELEAAREAWEQVQAEEDRRLIAEIQAADRAAGRDVAEVYL